MHGLLIVGLMLAGGCDKSEPVSAMADAAPTAAEDAAPKPAPTRMPGPDLGVEALRNELGCGKSGKQSEQCATVSEFEKSGAWNLDTVPAGQGRYFGKAIVIDSGEAQQKYYFLIVKKMPLNQVQAGDMPVRVVLRELEPTRESEINHAPKLLRLLERGNAVNKFNATADYVNGYAPAEWSTAAPTAGASSIVHTGSGAFVRQNEQRALLVAHPVALKPGAKAGDGIYAKLYPLSW